MQTVLYGSCACCPHSPLCSGCNHHTARDQVPHVIRLANLLVHIQFCFGVLLW